MDIIWILDEQEAYRRGHWMDIVVGYCENMNIDTER